MAMCDGVTSDNRHKN